MYRPEGIYVAMLTPFAEDGSVAEEVLRRWVDFLVEREVDGLFPASSVGEAVHMNPEERVRLMEIVADQNRGRLRLTPGAGSTHPAPSIRMAKKAQALGCDAVVLAPPYFYPLSQDMVEAYYTAIIQAVDLPVILYSVPIFTQPLGYDLVARLARHERVVGMKDSSGSMVDFVHFMDCAREAGAEMAFLTGREEILLPCLSAGGKGCMTATAGILPEIMVGVYRAWQAGDGERARRLQTAILPLVRAMFSLPMPLGFKVALEARGFEMGPPKQPLSPEVARRLQETRPRIQHLVTEALEIV